MTSILRQLSFVCILTVGLLASARGPESGGGGEYVLVNERPRLIDFYNILPTLKSDDRVASHFATPTRFSIEYQAPLNDPAFNLVLSIFKRWSDLPYDQIGLYINLAIYKPIFWNFTDDAVTSRNEYRPVHLSSDAKINTAAYYSMIERTYTVNVNRTVWNQFELQDQSALLIHETLRHIQIGHSLRFDDQALQKATAVMMLCKPTITLDQYLFYLLRNRRDIAEKNFESFERLTQNCTGNLQ